MKTEEIYWLAGWLEGEGSFFVTKTHRLVIQAFSVDFDVVEKVARLLGGNIISIKPRECSGTQWKSQGGHRTEIQGEAAATLMRRLFPLMGARRKAQIEQALEAWDSRPNRPIEKLCECGCGRRVFGGPRIRYASDTRFACAMRVYRARQEVRR